MILGEQVSAEEGHDALVHGGQLAAVEAGRVRQQVGLGRAQHARGGRRRQQCAMPAARNVGHQLAAWQARLQDGPAVEARRQPLVVIGRDEPQRDAGWASEAGSKSAAKGAPATTARTRGSSCVYQAGSSMR
jgi:hypothetical protein